MRVLCDNETVAQRDYVILQRFTIIASFIDVSLHALPPVCTGYSVIFAPWYFRFFLRFCLVLNSPQQCCGKREMIWDIGIRQVLTANSQKEQNEQKIKLRRIVPLHVYSVWWPWFWLLLGRYHLLHLTISTDEHRKWAVCSIYPLWQVFIRWNAWLDETSTLPIALVHVQSSDHLVFHAILSHYLTTPAFIVQHLHIDTKYIARFNAFTMHNGRSKMCKFRTSTFSYAIILATVCKSYLIFLVAQIFCRFCSCANCERGFIYIYLKMSFSLINEFDDNKVFL